MIQNNNVFAVIIGVGNYEESGVANLPTYRMDLAMIGSALEAGLKIPADNIRIVAGENNNGYVTTTALAHAIADFKSTLGVEDTFIFYFSGHGRDRNILLSNGQVELQSVINYIESLSAGSKVAILDCCYSGNFQSSGARVMHFEETMSEFAGRGIAVLASSSADEMSRLGPNGRHSMFTGALTYAITHSRHIKNGRVSLNDICDDTLDLVNRWNSQNPGKEQQPIFRSSIGGTIYFRVEDYKPYQQKQVEYDEGRYRILNVKPLSSGSAKRLAAFVITEDDVEQGDLPEITKEIAERICYAEVYSGKESEMRFGGTPARVVWCYFGHDESDIINSLHYAYTIWAADDEMKATFFRENMNATVIDDIYVYENRSYGMLKKKQEPTMTRTEFIESNRKLLALIVSMAERFIYDLQEVTNKTKTIEAMQEEYGDWIRRVKRRYIELSDSDVAPDDLHDWSAEILDLAGWVADLSIFLENEHGGGTIGEREDWLMKNAIRRYHEAVDKLKAIEEDINWDEEAP